MIKEFIAFAIVIIAVCCLDFCNEPPEIQRQPPTAVEVRRERTQEAEERPVHRPPKKQSVWEGWGP